MGRREESRRVTRMQIARREVRGWHGRGSTLGDMRSLCLSLGLLAGCTDAGAHLTLSAPSGPMKVTSFQIVLATPEDVPTITHQRTAPTSLETQSVQYYRQRTIAGGTHGKVDNIDGFAVRIEADPAIGTELIPFVLMYDGDTIVAVATFRAEGSAQPSPILVKTDEIDKYVLEVEPVAAVDDMDEVDAGQIRAVECVRDDQSTFTSGLVWRPKGGGEHRLVLPDDGGFDATGRELDLDCDGHAVTVESSGPDCDDSRGWFHRDARETCDGFDTNCDGAQNLVVACTGGIGTGNVCRDTTTNTGLALCDDRTGTQSVCASDPQCLCGEDPGACARCIVTGQAGSSTSKLKPCQPGIGYLRLESYCTDNEHCQKVEVVSAGGGWKVKLSPDVTPNVFGSSLQDVGPKVLVKIERPEGPNAEITGTLGASTGDILLAITAVDGTRHLHAIDLQFATDGGVCDALPYQVVCFP